jgi:hypothetical protein
MRIAIGAIIVLCLLGGLYAGAMHEGLKEVMVNYNCVLANRDDPENKGLERCMVSHGYRFVVGCEPNFPPSLRRAPSWCYEPNDWMARQLYHVGNWLSDIGMPVSIYL